jgi:hypothetical protein
MDNKFIHGTFIEDGSPHDADDPVILSKSGHHCMTVIAGYHFHKNLATRTENRPQQIINTLFLADILHLFADCLHILAQTLHGIAGGQHGHRRHQQHQCDCFFHRFTLDHDKERTSTK